MILIVPCDGVSPNIALAARTVNHSAEACLPGDSRQAARASAVRKHSPSKACDTRFTTTKPMA